MINANELRNQFLNEGSKVKVNKILDKIQAKLIEKSKEGKNELHFSLSFDEDTFHSLIEVELNNLGYNVIYYPYKPATYSHPIDNGSQLAYFIIKW